MNDERTPPSWREEAARLNTELANSEASRLGAIAVQDELRDELDEARADLAHAMKTNERVHGALQEALARLQARMEALEGLEVSVFTDGGEIARFQAGHGNSYQWDSANMPTVRRVETNRRALEGGTP